MKGIKSIRRVQWRASFLLVSLSLYGHQSTGWVDWLNDCGGDGRLLLLYRPSSISSARDFSEVKERREKLALVFISPTGGKGGKTAILAHCDNKKAPGGTGGFGAFDHLATFPILLL